MTAISCFESSSKERRMRASPEPLLFIPCLPLRAIAVEILHLLHRCGRNFRLVEQMTYIWYWRRSERVEETKRGDAAYKQRRNEASFQRKAFSTGSTHEKSSTCRIGGENIRIIEERTPMAADVEYLPRHDNKSARDRGHQRGTAAVR